MRSFLGSLAVFVLVGAPLVVAIDWVFGADDGSGLSLVVTVLVLSGLAVLQLLGAIARRHEGVWTSVPPLWATGPRESASTATMGQVDEWEALLVAATTGEDRGRKRLANKIERTLGVDVADAIPMGQPEPDEVLDAVEAVTERLEQADDH